MTITESFINIMRTHKKRDQAEGSGAKDRNVHRIRQRRYEWPVYDVYVYA